MTGDIRGAGAIMFVLFAAFFGVYVHTTAPHVAPYRDAGEMVVLGNTLGVAHPPGYPLYTLLTNVWKNLPVGNGAYRINVFSGLCAAGAVALLFLLMRTWIGPLPAFFAAVSLGFSTVFWELAAVSEMYALGATMLCLVFLALFRWKSAPLVAFLFALSLGVRMDLLLFIPLLLYWAWAENKIGEWKSVGGAAIVGLSIFLYMVLRSLQNPLLDWGNPDNLTALFNSMSRKSYASTLDLLSLNYKRGENFGINAVLYGRHLIGAFSIPGVLLALVGVYGLIKGQRAVALFFIGGFLIAGPLFLFMANMPPNPHAFAIIEASYLLPDIFVAVFIGFGLQTLFRSPMLFKAAVAATVIGLIVHVPSAYERVNKRTNFYVQDYLTNLFRSAPTGSVVALHKDVQIFSTWVAQIIDHKRRDVSIVPWGLSASAWYWDMKRRWPTKPSPEISLKDDIGWRQTVERVQPRVVLAGYDVDASNKNAVPHGLLLQITPTVKAPAAFLLSELCVYRGRYRYGDTPDFFSTDLIGDHAKAHHHQGLYAMNTGHAEEADGFFARSMALDPTFPRAASDRGYLAFTKGDYQTAKTYQSRAVAIYLNMLEQAKRFRALPDVVQSIKSDLSSTYLNLGVSNEKLGDVATARRHYAEAIAVFPNAQAYFNMAVTYWDKEWPKVFENLENCLRLNPQFPNGLKYLGIARAKAGAK